MNWICPICGEELGELNAVCEYCKAKDGSIVYNPDKYFVREIREFHIAKEIKNMEEVKGLTGAELIAHIEADQKMTPQEKLHAKLYYHETVFANQMDSLTLRAHIEELGVIAFKANTEYKAAKEVERQRSKKTEKGVTGFSQSLTIDETAQNAVNTIKERQKRLTKQEKLLENMKRLGIDGDTANKLMSAGTILAKLKDDTSRAKEIVKGEETRSPLSQENGFVIAKKPEDLAEKKPFESKPFTNPFKR